MFFLRPSKVQLHSYLTSPIPCGLFYKYLSMLENKMPALRHAVSDFSCFKLHFLDAFASLELPLVGITALETGGVLSC